MERARGAGAGVGADRSASTEGAGGTAGIEGAGTARGSGVAGVPWGGGGGSESAGRGDLDSRLGSKELAGVFAGPSFPAGRWARLLNCPKFLGSRGGRIADGSG